MSADETGSAASFMSTHKRLDGHGLNFRQAHCRLRFLRVGVSTLADALQLPVQAVYLDREVPAAVIVIYRQTRTRHASLTSCIHIHTAAPPADLHTSLCHLAHLRPLRCATTDTSARARTRSGMTFQVKCPSAGELRLSQVSSQTFTEFVATDRLSFPAQA
jgi:hypothetical protein